MKKGENDTMNNNDATAIRTVEHVLEIVKPQITLYRKFPSKKNDVVEVLRPLFEMDSEIWPIVIDMGNFKESFKKKMGKKGMGALKKILLVIDEAHYKEINFS